jgi:hypothetical protein
MSNQEEVHVEFRLDKAVETLRSVAVALAQAWPTLDEEARRKIAALIREHGEKIYIADSINVAGRVAALLGALWRLRAELPEAARQALAEGQGVSETFMVSVDEGTRRAILADLVRVADVRAFERPRSLAVRVSALVGAHLDRLTGPEREQWQALEDVYRAGGDPDAYLHAVEALLAGYQAVRKLLEEGKTWVMTRTAEIGTPTPKVVAAPAAAAEPKTPVRELTRFANVHFPATVLLSQKMVPLIVHIAQQYQAKEARIGEEQARLTLRVGDLTIVLHAEGFEVAQAIGGLPVPDVPAARTVKVEEERDCEPAVFFLNPQTPGRKRIAIDVYQFSRNITTLAFETDVADQAAIGELANVGVTPVAIVSPGAQALPPDLELRVMLGSDRRTLYYCLHSPAASDYNFKPAGQVTLEVEPRDFLQRTFDRLSVIARKSEATRTPQETQQFLQELTDIGANLYNDLFSPELKAEYGRLRTKYAGKSLLITSDEPWIPWEMVKPFAFDDQGNELYNDLHLCERFRVSRWLAGRGSPDLLALKNSAVVAAADNLQAVKEETGYFANLHQQNWDISFREPLSTVAAVRDTLRAGQTQLLHFACHGNFDASDPNESRLKLADGMLRPSQIIAEAQAGLLRARPLIFLNACHTGQTDFALTRLGGWAQRFIESGASAFIGSLWEINDRLAARFAREFYNRLWGLEGCPKMTSGEAFYQARLAIKQADPANPTWLAYVLYGDPHGQVVLGAVR